MTPERFQQVEELYHAVREKTAAEREALLAETDPELRREIESLLIQRPGGELLERPAIQNAPQLLADSAATQLVADMNLGPYRIESKLGEGGMGEVFRAVDTRLGRPVAIKTAYEQFSARFEREARVLSSLNHPHICTLYDVGPNYLVMELVEGETIAARLKSGPLPLKTALLYASQILAALVEAHGKGILHRDLKPSNIMIAKSGVKVLDFGLAKLGHDETLTTARVVLGTPAYMAPEQRGGKAADVRSDIYSFGCVLYEMVTGARITWQRKRIPSRQLERIVLRCLEENPERRWQTAVELEREIGRVKVGPSARTIASAAAAVLALVAGVGYFYFQRAPKLSDTDIVVLADFVNDTGDPIFDRTLRQGLAIQFEQSPFLKIMDDDQMHRVLRLMSLKTDTRVTNQVAREICVREGAAATIDGTIASLGKSYVLTLQAVACQSGTTLAREQIQAVDKEHVLNALGTAATLMRGKLGESRKSIQTLNRPLEQATTGSLEALQTYTAALHEMMRGRYPATIPLWERAIAIDPNFAMAYYFLGVAFDQAGDMARARENATQAFRLIDRVSEYERTSITGFYYSMATGELDKAIDVYQSGIRNYPRFWGFRNQLATMYIDLGRYEDALNEGVEAARLSPNAEPPYRRQLDAYICLNRLPEAKQLAERLRANGIDGVRIHQRYLEMAYIEEDQGAITREMQWFAGKPSEYVSLGLEAAYRNVHGQRRESQKLFQRAAESALRQGLKNAASELEEADARADALSGNCQTVRRLGRPALALAMCGDAARAERLAADSAKLFGNGTLWNTVQLPAIRAAVALAGDPAKSVEHLVSALPYERGNLEAIYLRGLAYLRLQKGAEAAAEFHKILDHKGANWASAWRYPYWGQFYALSHLGLARSAVVTHDAATARRAFEEFLALWKDADPDLPVLKQAKAEYAMLQ